MVGSAKVPRQRQRKPPQTEPIAKVARMSKAPAPARASVVQMSGTPVAGDEIVPE